MNLIAVVVFAALAAGALYRFSSHGQLDGSRWHPFVTWPTWRFLLRAFRSSLEAGGGTAGLSFVLGLGLALLRLSPRPAVSGLAAAFTELFRSIPALLLIYITLFALPKYGINLPLYWKLVAPLTVTSMATVAEIFRAGILSLEKGQGEAGASLGLTRSQVMRAVILPQAVRRVVPALVSQAVSILKDTSLGYVVSYNELLFSGQIYTSYSKLLIQTYLVIAGIYLVVNLALSKVARLLDGRAGRRLARSESAPDVDSEVLLAAARG